MDTDAVSEAEMGEEGREGTTPWRPNAPLHDLPPGFDYTAYTTAFDETVAAEDLCDPEELTRLQGLSRPAAAPPAGCGDQARQPAAAAADGAAEPQLGFRSGGRAARRGAAGADRHLARPRDELQGRARHEVSRHRRHPADRQFGVDARPADLDRGDLRRHPRPHPRTLLGQDRDPRLHDARVEGRPVARKVAGGGAAGKAGAAQRPAPHHLQAGRRAVAAGAQEPRADDARGAAQGEYRRRGAALGAQPDARAERRTGAS